MIRLYVRNILVALDQLANALLGGDPDETLSSRAGKRPDRWYWRALVATLETIDPGHIGRTREDDEGSDALYHPRDRSNPNDR